MLSRALTHRSIRCSKKQHVVRTLICSNYIFFVRLLSYVHTEASQGVSARTCVVYLHHTQSIPLSSSLLLVQKQISPTHNIEDLHHTLLQTGAEAIERVEGNSYLLVCCTGTPQAAPLVVHVALFERGEFRSDDAIRSDVELARTMYPSGRKACGDATSRVYCY
jgi:hypothetical protein